jgi:hypothetical protein
MGREKATAGVLGLGAVLLNAGPLLFGGQFSAQIVDNLGTPVPGARIVAYCNNGGHLRTLVLRSDSGGIVTAKGTCQQAIRVRLSKEGYGTSLYDELSPVYVLRRKVRADSVHRIAQLDGPELETALREMLTSEVEGPFQELAFYYEDRLRPTLRALAQEPDAAVEARSLLAFIGVPEDLRLIAQLGTLKGLNPAFAYRWLYGVVCSLLEPASEEEWDLLRGSALNEYKDFAVNRGAIQTLRLIASLRSREILGQVKDPPYSANSVAKAIEYIQSNPPPLTNQNLEELASRVARSLNVETWSGNGEPRYNRAGDKALVNFNFDAGSDIYIYTSVFQRIDGVWFLRGVRETLQGLKGRAVTELLRKRTSR